MGEPRRRPRPRFVLALAASALGLSVALATLLLSRDLLAVIPAAILVVGAWLVPVLYAERFRGAITLLKPASRTDVHGAKDAAVNAVNDSRAKASRHEYHQEQALARIENELRRLAALPSGDSHTHMVPETDVMLVTSNGAGLGHVSRLLAVADRLPSGRQIELLTLSAAYQQAVRPGLTVHYFPSSEAAAETPARWNRVFRDYIRRMLVARRPRVVVFDGTWVYSGLTDVCRALGIPLVWMQRGMWKPDVDRASPQRHAAAEVAEHVIVPGDYAEAETVDAGRGVEPQYVGPIVGARRKDLLQRAAACARLGLEPERRYVLLNLGGGSISDADSIAHEVLTRMQVVSPDLVPVQVVSPLASPLPDVPGLIRISAYPVMPCARAFEYMVAAAGYNSSQEAVSLGIPTVLVPNVATKTDDQVRRARALSDQGLCLVAESRDALENAIEELGKEETRAALRDRLEAVPEATGALDAASIIEQISKQADWASRAETIVSDEKPDSSPTRHTHEREVKFHADNSGYREDR